MAQVNVLGLGNILLRDEGVGVHIVQALEKMQLASDVKLIDGGTASLDALDLVDDGDCLLVVDAARGGGLPGTIYRLKLSDLESGKQKPYSLHQVGFLESLRMSRLSGRNFEEVVIIGVEPKDLNPGLELSSELRERMPGLISIVLKEANRMKGEN